MTSGQSLRACPIDIAERKPNSRAGYEAAAITARGWCDEITTGKCFSSGRSRNSTEA